MAAHALPTFLVLGLLSRASYAIRDEINTTNSTKNLTKITDIEQRRVSFQEEAAEVRIETIGTSTGYNQSLNESLAEIRNPNGLERTYRMDQRFRIQADDRPKVVLSDVDDTMFASGGDSHLPAGPIAGSDNTYYAKEVYPGVARFALEVSRGPQETNDDISHLFVLSARPDQLSDLHFKEDGPENAYWKFVGSQSPGAVAGWGLDIEGSFYGRLRDFILSGVPGVLGGYGDTNCEMGYGNTKFQAWAQYGEFDGGHPQTVFVGDNGQCDQWAAERMLARTEEANPTKHGPDCSGCVPYMAAAFIHVVAPFQRPKHDRIFPFNTYADAAQTAFANQLITVQGFGRVLSSVTDNAIFKMCVARACNLLGGANSYQCVCDMQQGVLQLKPGGGSVQAWCYGPDNAAVCENGATDPDTGARVSEVRRIGGPNPQRNRCEVLIKSWQTARDAWVNFVQGNHIPLNPQQDSTLWQNLDACPRPAVP